MTQEDKQLLLKDLCARLPYGVKICVGGDICMLLDINTEMGDKSNGETFYTVGFNKPDGNYDFCAMTEVKPYLRPMSSMTEEECNEFFLLSEDIVRCGERGYCCGLSLEQIDWLNSHHFDFRGLIEKGLAIEAPKGMYEKK